MKRLPRSINIFSISALDLFAAAMGAFIIIAVILFPYYMKNSGPVRQAIGKLTKQINDLDQQRAQAVQEEQKQKKEIATLNMKMIDFKRQQERALQEAQEHKQEIAGLKKELQTALEKLAVLQGQEKEIKRLNNEIIEAERQHNQATRNVQDHKNEIAKLKKELQTALDTLAVLQHQEKEIRRLNNKIIEAERQHNQAARNVQDYKQEIAKLKKQLRAALQGQEKEIKRLNNKMIEAQRERDEAVRNVQNYKNEIVGLKKQLRTASEKRAVLQGQKKEINRLNKKMIAAEHERDEAIQNTQAYKNEIVKLKKQLQKALDERTDPQDQKKKIDRLNKKMIEAERRRDQAVRNAQDHKNEIAKLNMKIDKAIHQRDQANQKLRALKKENARLKEQKKKLQKALNKPMDQTFLSLTKEINKLKVQNKKLRKEKKQSEARASQELQALEKEIVKLEEQNKRSKERTVKFALFGIATRADSFVVLVDMSESMKKYADSMQTAVRQLTEQLDARTTLQMIGYRDVNGRAELHYWLPSRKLIPMTADAKGSVIRFAANLVQGFDGFTPTYAALQEALRYNADAVILITDGDPTDLKPNDIIKNITSQNSGKKEIHCVALGNYCNMPKFTAFLQELAGRNRGGFLGMPK